MKSSSSSLEDILDQSVNSNRRIRMPRIKSNDIDVGYENETNSIECAIRQRKIAPVILN